MHERLISDRTSLRKTIRNIRITLSTRTIRSLLGRPTRLVRQIHRGHHGLVRSADDRLVVGAIPWPP